jgi:hypothetical protein
MSLWNIQNPLAQRHEQIGRLRLDQTLFDQLTTFLASFISAVSALVRICRLRIPRYSRESSEISALISGSREAVALLQTQMVWSRRDPFASRSPQRTLSALTTQPTAPST